MNHYALWISVFSFIKWELTYLPVSTLKETDHICSNALETAIWWTCTCWKPVWLCQVLDWAWMLQVRQTWIWVLLILLISCWQVWLLKQPRVIPTSWYLHLFVWGGLDLVTLMDRIWQKWWVVEDCCILLIYSFSVMFILLRGTIIN